MQHLSDAVDFGRSSEGIDMYVQRFVFGSTISFDRESYRICIVKKTEQQTETTSFDWS